MRIGTDIGTGETVIFLKDAKEVMMMITVVASALEALESSIIDNVPQECKPTIEAVEEFCKLIINACEQSVKFKLNNVMGDAIDEIEKKGKDSNNNQRKFRYGEEVPDTN